MEKRRYLRLPLTLSSALLFGLAAYFVPQLNAVVDRHADQQILSILASICASFVFLFTLDLSQFTRDFLHGRDFRTFFGDLSDRRQAVLVYPDFELSGPASLAFERLGSGELFVKRSVHYPGSRFIDIPQIIASNDLQAMVIMATCLGSLLGDSPRLLTDGQAVCDPDNSFISFGLTSNALTDRYLQTDLEPMFRITDASGDPKLVIQQSDGQSATFGKDDLHQHGLILRYRPCPEEFPSRYWFICAGLAAAGTPAAAWLLAHKWQHYYKRFKQKDFVLIFKTSNDIFSYSHSVEVASRER